MKMKLEDAMVYCLAMADRGLKPEMMTHIINERKLHVRVDGKPVTEKQIWAAIFRHPEVFVWEGGIIHLLM